MNFKYFCNTYLIGFVGFFVNKLFFVGEENRDEHSSLSHKIAQLLGGIQQLRGLDFTPFWPPPASSERKYFTYYISTLCHITPHGLLLTPSHFLHSYGMPSLSHLSIKQCDKMTLNVSAKLVRKTQAVLHTRQIRVDRLLLTLYYLLSTIIY